MKKMRNFLGKYSWKKLIFILIINLLGIWYSVDVVKAQIDPNSTLLHLKNIQKLLTSNIVRIVDNVADTNPQSQFMKDVLYFSQKDYQIFNFKVHDFVDDPLKRAQKIIEVLQAIDLSTGKNNYIVPELSYGTRNTDRAIKDRLSDGTVVYHDSNICPNYSFVDLSDEGQTNKYADFIMQMVEYLEQSPESDSILGYYPIWGWWGENGLFAGGLDSGCTGINGEFAAKLYPYWSVSAGYSENMLESFKIYYQNQQANGVIPRDANVDLLVSSLNPSADAMNTWPFPEKVSPYSARAKYFSYFLMYRKHLQRSFNEKLVSSIKSVDGDKAIIGVCNLVVNYTTPANGWSFSPGVDFCEGAISVGTYGIGSVRKMYETDYVGVSDFSVTEGSRSNTNWFKSESEKVLKMGGNIWTFNRFEYHANGVIDILDSVNLNRMNTVSNPYKYNSQVAVFIPTFSRAMLAWNTPGLTFKSPGLFGLSSWDNIADLKDVVQALLNKNITFDLVSEDELLNFDNDNNNLQKYKLIIIPYNNLFSGLFPTSWQKITNSIGGKIVTGDSNGLLSLVSLNNAINNLVLSTPDRCVSYCDNRDLTYLLDDSCKLTCDVEIQVSPTPNSGVLGDLNTDGVVNIQDFILLSNAFGTNDSRGDLNSDGVVNIQDFVILSNNFGKTGSTQPPTPTPTPTPVSAPVCQSGYGDCDGDPANGCETSLNTTSNCGSCGNVCGRNERCRNGFCEYRDPYF